MKSMQRSNKWFEYSNKDNYLQVWIRLRKHLIWLRCLEDQGIACVSVYNEAASKKEFPLVYVEDRELATRWCLTYRRLILCCRQV